MMKGMEKFKEYFNEFSNQYVLIGGSACEIAFANLESVFRVTKDLDMVLVMENQTKEFGETFWKFIKDGGYINKVSKEGNPQFFRFEKPCNPDFPQMIELFSRTEWTHDEVTLTPIHIDDSVSSLSAILLDDSYYKLLLEGQEVVNGISVLNPSYIILFKIKAWLDFYERISNGEHVDSRNLKKHRNDIVRIAAEMPLRRVELDQFVKDDVQRFLDNVKIDFDLLKNLGINTLNQADIIQLLKEIYNL